MKKRKEENRTSIVLDAEMHQGKVKIMQTVFFIFFIFISLLFLLPIVWILLSAFKDTQEFMQLTPALFPKEIDLSKMYRVWEKTKLGRAYWSTLIMVAGQVFFAIFCCGLGGYVLSRIKPIGSRAVLVVVLWSMMMPSNLSMVPLFISFTKEIPILGVNMMDSYVPFWIMAGANAFYTLLFKSFFDGIPKTYLEAARIDGSTELGIFARVILPLSKPVFISVAILVVTSEWGQFLWPSLVIKDEALRPIGLLLYQIQSNLSVDEYMMAMIFVIIPPVIFFVLFQKYIMEGISIGGIKG